jgi:biotin carboxylase
MAQAKKKLMLLGGLRYLLPVIEVAHRHGIHVITVDYLPDNIAHKYSDEYHNVSIIDKEAVLKLAQQLQIDGIMSFAVDPGVVAAAYTAEKMGLPFQCSYEAACILQDKSRFRKFLADNGFNVPNARGYSEADDALKDVNYFNWPVIVKPVDSAGSKGVTRVDVPADLPAAIAHALDCSPSRHFIIEDFLEKVGCSSDTDSLSVDGDLVFCTFNNQYFDEDAENEYTPAAYSWPSSMPQAALDELRRELQRLVDLMEMKTGLYNIETRLCSNGKAYIMEVSPRAGGNRLAEMLKYVTGEDIIERATLAAVNEPFSPISHGADQTRQQIVEIILHANQSGTFTRLEISPELRQIVVEEDLWVKPGTQVETFTGANMAIGTLALRAESQEDVDRIIQLAKHGVQVLVS